MNYSLLSDRGLWNLWRRPNLEIDMVYSHRRRTHDEALFPATLYWNILFWKDYGLQVATIHSNRPNLRSPWRNRTLARNSLQRVQCGLSSPLWDDLCCKCIGERHRFCRVDADFHNDKNVFVMHKETEGQVATWVLPSSRAFNDTFLARFNASEVTAYSKILQWRTTRSMVTAYSSACRLASPFRVPNKFSITFDEGHRDNGRSCRYTSGRFSFDVYKRSHFLIHTKSPGLGLHRTASRTLS